MAFGRNSLFRTQSSTSKIPQKKLRQSISHLTIPVFSLYTRAIAPHNCQDFSVSGGGGIREFTFNTSRSLR